MKSSSSSNGNMGKPTKDWDINDNHFPKIQVDCSFKINFQY